MSIQLMALKGTWYMTLKELVTHQKGTDESLVSLGSVGESIGSFLWETDY